MSCHFRRSMWSFYAGTNCCSLSEVEIRSRFFLRAPSNRSLRRESQTKNISSFGCVRVTDTVARFILMARRLNFRLSHGTWHFELGWTSMRAKLWSPCVLRRCAQRNAFEGPSSNLQIPETHQPQTLQRCNEAPLGIEFWNFSGCWSLGLFVNSVPLLHV